MFDDFDRAIAVYKSVDDGQDFEFVAINEAVEAIDKVKREDTVGCRLTEKFPGVREFGLLDVMERVWRTGEPDVLPATEYVDGRIKGWRENRVFRLKNGYVVAVYEDVTEREEARLRQISVEERYRLLTESSLDGVWDWDLTTNELYISPRWKAQIGYADDELENSFSAFEDNLHPEDKARVMGHVAHFLTNPESVWAEEFRLRHKDGGYRWTLARGTPVLNDDGKVIRLFGVHVDISELKAAEEKINQAAKVFESTIEGVSITDLEASILDVNEAFSDITGYSRAEVLGKNPRLLQSGRHESAFYDEMWQSLTTSGMWRGEIWNKHKLGHSFPMMLTINQVVGSDGSPTGYVGIFSDITALKQSEERLQYQATHDALTNLPNRSLLNEQLEQSINRARRNGETVTVAFIDLDRFKNINDSLGHSAGDSLLIECAYRLKQVMRSNDVIARISGDEFIAVLEDVGNRQNAALTIQKILQTFNQPFQLKDQLITVTCSVGASLFPDDGDDAESLMRNADTAMYLAKEDGRNGYQFYTQDMTETVTERIAMENALRDAVKNNEFYLVYQPQIDLLDRHIIGFEVLLRWQHPQLGNVPPSRFIELAERIGVIHEIGEWLIREVCDQATEWRSHKVSFGKLAINVSRRELQNTDFYSQIWRALVDADLPPELIEIEVTETYLSQHEKETQVQLETLHGTGISIAIDDFGTGYSSLHYLKVLPVNKLKIDQSFVRGIPRDKDDMAICEAIIALGDALNLEVIAEGVENKEQANFLKEKNCRQVQGFYYAMPMTADKVMPWIIDYITRVGKEVAEKAGRIDSLVKPRD